MSTLQATNLKHASSASNNLVLDSSGNATAAGTVAMATPFAMRNKIINGAMEIDQRNAGAAVDGNGGNLTFPVDRFYSQIYNTSGNTTGQQSSTAPAGFTNSLRITVKTADTSVGSTDQVWYGQSIEGLNLTEFGLGTASAATFTISFWVYSNVTGTYCVCLKNSAENRTYVAEYTINSSATWEKKTITIAGDTTGTWLRTNGTGLKVWFVLMAGSGVTTSANAWSSAAAIATSNQVNFMSSTANYWQITGVQLEVGSVATPFERRNYQQEFAMCQRYYETGSFLWRQYGVISADASENYQFKVTKRAVPTLTYTTSFVNNFSTYDVRAATVDKLIIYGIFNGTSTGGFDGNFTASAEL